MSLQRILKGFYKTEQELVKYLEDLAHRKAVQKKIAYDATQRIDLIEAEQQHAETVLKHVQTLLNKEH